MAIGYPLTGSLSDDWSAIARIKYYGYNRPPSPG